MGVVAVIFALAALGVAIALFLTRSELRRRTLENDTHRQHIQELTHRVESVREVEERYRPILDLEAAVRTLEAKRDSLILELEERQRTATAERELVEGEIDRLRHELDALSTEQLMAEFGLYEPRYDFEDSERYKAELAEVRARQKEMVKAKTAAVCDQTWMVEGSAAKGKKMVSEQLKLMLRAFNGECDGAIAKVKYNNVAVIEKRITKAFEALNKLGSTKACSIADWYLSLKISELRLFHEHAQKRQEEREEQRRIKEEMREEKRAEAEMMREIKKAEAEEKRAADALAKARKEISDTTGAKHDKMLAKIAELERRLREAHSNKDRATSQAQMTRCGHVYIISNIGSFGEEVFKIGMTRRLDPMDRVKELGDASVPFPFDVHAMIFANDAPKLERELHKKFHSRRVNRVNERKEFFRVALSEIASAATNLHGEFTLTKLAAAEDYRKTLAMAQRPGRSPLAKTAAPEPQYV